MTKLPDVTGREVIKALSSDGWVIKGQKGSHVKLVKPGVSNPVIVPVHGKSSIPKGTLSSIIKDTGLSVEELITLIQRR